MSRPEPWRIRRYLLSLIETDKYAAYAEAGKLSRAWVSPDLDKMAFYRKTAKRYSYLYALGLTLPEDKRDDMDRLFLVWMDYKECLKSETPKNVILERRCYEQYLMSFLEPESRLVKAEAAHGVGTVTRVVRDVFL